MLQKKFVIKKICFDNLGNTSSLFDPTDEFGQTIFPIYGFESLQNAENALYHHLLKNVELDINGNIMSIPLEYTIIPLYGFEP